MLPSDYRCAVKKDVLPDVTQSDHLEPVVVVCVNSLKPHVPYHQEYKLRKTAIDGTLHSIKIDDEINPSSYDIPTIK